jgi:hypothetical protein
MAYTLQYSLGTITVVDTTLNNQTSLNLPGRNYAGYGAPVDQNQLSILENFASYPGIGPTNPIPGQTWFDTSTKGLKVNISNTSTATWSTLITNGTIDDVTFANVIVNGNLKTNNITTGGASIPGTMTGAWSLTSGSSFSTSNGTLTADLITTGGATVPGEIIGAWTLGAGSTFNATYADLAERFEADMEYDQGTVVELGGSAEITAVREELSEDVFGVISTTAGYTMNAAAGSQKTHPAIAMTGRVPVKVRGAVKKGDRLVSAGKGYARAALKGEANSFNTVGRSLEDKLTDGEGKVLAAVSAKL